MDKPMHNLTNLIYAPPITQYVTPALMYVKPHSRVRVLNAIKATKQAPCRYLGSDIIISRTNDIVERLWTGFHRVHFAPQLGFRMSSS